MAFEIVKDVLHIATFAGAIAMLMCEIVSFAKTKAAKAGKSNGEETIKQFEETCDYGCKYLTKRWSSGRPKYRCEIFGYFDNSPLYCKKFSPKCEEEGNDE